MKNPPHPGETVRYDCLEALGLSVTVGAKLLGVSRQSLNNVVNGRSGISALMAIRLEQVFGSTAETWLRVQMTYDLDQARKQEGKAKLKRYRPAKEPRVTRKEEVAAPPKRIARRSPAAKKQTAKPASRSKRHVEHRASAGF